MLLFFLPNNYAQQQQKVTLRLKNATLREVFNTIEKQTTFHFSYRDAIIDNKKDISITKNNASVSSVLDELLKGRNLDYKVISSKSIIITDKQSNSSQSGEKKKITGVVKDMSGEPIIGANIKEKGADIGTITDIDGKFEILIGSNDILQISYIGYQNKEVKPGKDNHLVVTLEDSEQQLDEVVVVGYGTAKKIDLTGSVSSLDGKKLKSNYSPQLSNQLQGQMAGVQVTRSNGDPSSGTSIRVRGITTMSTNDPLVIIDGVPGYLNYVSPEDVQDIQVLKDAASAAIYGSRAAAGVILITTKRAKNKEFSLSYNAEYSIDAPTSVPEFANAVDWMTGFNEMKYNDGASDLYSAYSQDFINEYNNNHRTDPDNNPDTDWMSFLKKSTSHQKHSLSLTGGTDKLKTKFSLNYYSSDALYDVKEYSRFNIRSNNDYNINEWIHANIDMNLAYAKNIKPHGDPVSNLMQASPLYNAYWADGTYADGKDGDNPLAAIALGGVANNKTYRFSGKMQLDLKPVKDLVITMIAAPNYSFSKNKNQTKKIRYRKLNGDYIYASGYGATNLKEERNDNHSLTMQFYANYKLNISKHTLNAMAGYEDYSYSWENLNASRDNYLLDNFPYLNLGPEDYQYNGGDAGHNAYRSVFGRLMYNYNGKYILQANVRSDGSSRFAKGYRWGTFPSVSAGWIMSEESWFKNNIIDYLKLRGSVGQLGNERIGSEFPYQALLNFGTAYIPNTTTRQVDVVQTAFQSDYAFKNITWETTTTYGLGFDMNLLNSRLKFVCDVYYKKTKDMLLQIGFPSYFGYNSPQSNAADMHTKGWDLELSWNDQINDFRYGVSFNLSDYRSIMGYMADKQVIGSNKITEKGSYYREWYMYKSEGIILDEDAMYNADGTEIALLTANDKPGCIKYKDFNGDGVINASNDRVKLGNSLPELLYGGSAWAEWKNFDFNLSFQGVGHQNSYWNWSSIPYRLQAFSCPQNVVDSHWSPNNTREQNAKAKYPMYTTNTTNIYAGSSFYLFNGAYMRIKNITLGYTVPKEISKLLLLNKLRVYFSANDLPAFSHYPKGYDPEWDRSSDLIMSSYIFGLNLTF